jgi:hypothetical protein
MVMVDGEQTMAVRFGGPLVMVMVASSEVTAQGMAPVVTVPTGGPSPSNNPAREGSVGRVVGTSLDGDGN